MDIRIKFPCPNLAIRFSQAPFCHAKRGFFACSAFASQERRSAMTAALLNDEYYMRLALQLAGAASGQTGIN
ncbi:hypothetical protein, partial [Paenibacillus validus]|uniref:hypothetical protein n=1 Tax=Paenibacillus validus TaxID=44253 RepID=UPI002E1D05B3|nr:hypothetical protein [Paenibacillus validus]